MKFENMQSLRGYLFNYNQERGEKKVLVIDITYSDENFNEHYSLDSRTYRTFSDEKFFKTGVCGSSLYGSALDGSDDYVRLDLLDWEVENIIVH